MPSPVDIDTRRDFDRRASKPAAAQHPQLPLVSVIVVNHNYARYLRQAIDSVFSQSYARIECIVVDDASTDDSAAVIAACQKQYPTLVVERLTENVGQTAASVAGFRRSTGLYVVFLDADDFLLDDCVATHVRVHLGARRQVGFTSGDMLQVVDGQVISSANESMSAHFAAHMSDGVEVLRPYDRGLPSEPLRACFVSSRERHWVWAPTSGNCFRRDALRLFCDGAGLDRLRSQADLYFVVGINGITGSVLIDAPLFAYRLHDANAFSVRPQISGLVSYDPARSAGNAQLAKRLIVDQYLAKVGAFVQEPSQRTAFFKTLLRIGARCENGSFGYAATAMRRRFGHVAAHTGYILPLLFVAAFGWLPLVGLRKPPRTR